MTRGFASRVTLALVGLAPVVFMWPLATARAGGAWTLIGELALYAAFLSFTTVFVPLASLLGSAGRMAWMIVAAAAPVWLCAVRFPHLFAAGNVDVDAFAVVETFGAAAWLAFTLAVAVKARALPAGDTLALAPPVREGVFTVVQGGSSRFVNHHASSAPQRFAVDLVRQPVVRRRACAIVSPLAGTVVAAVDGLADFAVPARERRAHPFGNHVIVRDPHSGADIVLAHLAHGSLAVVPGQTVAAGDRLGELGNSGNSTEPHVHMHAERDGMGIPFTIGGRFLVRNAVLRGALSTERREQTHSYHTSRDGRSRMKGVAS